MDEYQPQGQQPDSRSHEISVLQGMIQDQFKEQRRQHRWKIFFRFVLVGLLIAIPIISSLSQNPAMLGKDNEHIALIDLEGVILAGTPAEADTINGLLIDAFKNEHSKGVILRINSPGGSPVQSSRINRKIQSLRRMYPDKPIYAVVSDVCASGAYYIAVAATAIYADASSLVGSIGVIYNGFGFTEAMDKIGVERRVITAGKHKNLLDPFSAESAYDKKYIQKLIDQMHGYFILAVKEGRKGKLKEQKDIFSGLVWTGQDAVNLGLVDGLGDMEYIATLIGLDSIIEYKAPLPWLERLFVETRVQIKQILLEQMLFATPL